MEKLLERLTEKYLLKDIRRITLEIYAKEFDSLFSDCCETKLNNDNTLGFTFRYIEDLAHESVIKFFKKQAENIRIESDSDNPFKCLIEHLWDDAGYYFSFKPYVCSILDDEYQGKESELIKLGLIDENGDYIAK